MAVLVPLLKIEVPPAEFGYLTESKPTGAEHVQQRRVIAGSVGQGVQLLQRAPPPPPTKEFYEGNAENNASLIVCPNWNIDAGQH
jgi:hypothetical protein